MKGEFAKVLYTTNEPITVGVVCVKRGNMRPQWFIWGGREYRVTRINHIWRDKKGEKTQVFFSVIDKSNTYLLCYHTMRMEWTLCGVDMEG